MRHLLTLFGPDFDVTASDEPEFDEEMMAALALSSEQASNSDNKLTEIVQFLRKALPISALAPEESMSIPKGVQYEGYTEKNTLHVDEFLYTDEEAQELTNAGLLPQDYCGECGSHDIKHLSTSVTVQLRLSTTLDGLKNHIL